MLGYNSLDQARIAIERERRKRRKARQVAAEKLGLLEWARQYLPHFNAPSAPFHHELAELLAEHDYTAFAAPRGHAKSVVVTLAFALWRAATGKARYVMIISDSREQAGERLGDIYNELASNTALVRDYPHLRLPEMSEYKKKRAKRTVGHIITSGGVTFRGVGSGTRLRGARTGEARPDLIISDDLENDKNVSTPEQREKLKNWFMGAVMGLGGAGGAQVTVVGTILHEDSFLANLLDNEEWVTRKWRAINEDGSLLWPGHFTHEHLGNLKRRMGEPLFNQEYLNMPLSDEYRLFKGAWYYDELPNTGFVEIVGFDAAYTKKSTSDYTALVWLRWYGGEHYYLTRAERTKVAPEELVPWLKRHGVHRLAWFAAGTEKGTIALLRMNGIHVDDFTTSGTDKRSRAMPASSDWNAGRILLPQNTPWSATLLSEMHAFTGLGEDQHDDQVDAFSAAHHVIANSPRAESESYI